MTAYWGIRTSKEKHELIGEYLAQGVLRQGWGDRDLRELRVRADDGSLDPEGRSVWRYTQRMLDIAEGDIVVTPHQPEWGQNGIWRVTGPYEFDPLPDVWDGQPDFGNVIRVEPIGLFDHRSATVSSGLRTALGRGFRPRMRQLNDHADEIETLIRSEDAMLPSDAAAHFSQVRNRAREALYDGLVEQYGSADFEKPIGALLETIYPNAVRHTAGPAEQGRDFVIEDRDPLGLTRSVIVQVKSWSGPINKPALQHGLNQLRDGVTAQTGTVDLAVLLTLADELPPDAETTIGIVEQEIAVPIRVLLKDETLDLLLDQIAHMHL